MKRYVELHRPGKPIERHEFDAPLAWTAGGGTETLRPLDGAGAHVLQLHPETAGARAFVIQSAASGMILDGCELRDALIAWGADAYFQGARIAIVQESASAGRSRVVALGVACAALIGVAALLAGGTSSEASARRDLEAPALFGSEAPCPERERSRAEHRARDAEQRAQAKRERFAFEPRDGIEAVLLFREARACYAVADDSQAERRVRSALDAWSGQVTESYRAAELRLRVALDSKRWADALSAVKELESLLAGRDASAYLEWLGALRRELERKGRKRRR